MAGGCLKKDESSKDKIQLCYLNYNFGHKTLVPPMFYQSFHSPQVKYYLISSIANLGHKLPYELSKNLRLRILED